MDQSHDEPLSKRLKLDSPADDSAIPVVPATLDPFSFERETGLFGSVYHSLGLAASTELEVGISEYVDPTISGFSAIIKHRFTDFLVYEVGMDGEVVRLKDIVGPAPAPKPVVVVEPKEEGAAPPVVVPIWNDEAEAAIALLLTPAKLEEFKTFVLAGPPPPLNRGRKVEEGGLPPASIPSFLTDVIVTKEGRTAIHLCLRQSFTGKFNSEMKMLESGDQVIEILWNKSGNKGERKPRDKKTAADGSALPRYIHFTLEKTNKEMHDALSGLTRTLNIQNRDLGTAGTKDKRAITTQRVSMARGNKTIEDVWKAARGAAGGGGRGRGSRGRGGAGRGGYQGAGGSDRGVRIGDMEYSDSGLELGQLKGNKFVITLRDIQVDSISTISRAMSTISTLGFLNYYGMQRFGTAPIPTHVIGLALLQSNWALAAHLILRPREGEGEDVAYARQVCANGNFKEAAAIMPRRAVAEKAILDFYAYGDANDHLSALTRIPKNLRMMYVHAWQSYIFNRVLSERVRLFGCAAPIVGDLVLADGLNAGATSGEEVPVVESLEPDLEGDDTSAPGPTVGGTGNNSKQAKIVLNSRVAQAKLLTAADIANETYTIFDVILPMPGFAVLYPGGVLGEKYREIMRSDGIDPDNLFRKQKEYSLGGAYRAIMHLPTNVAHRLILSTSPTEDLAQSDSDALLNLPPPVLIPYPIDSPTPEEGTMALQLELTLGSSTYATMALREVLKTRTSAKSQKDLTVEMEKRVEAEGIELEEAKEAAREALETVVVLDESKQVGEPIIVD